MPLESLSCTGCGSTDVKEVKPDTYFCNHCETVFKQIDPSKVTVAPAFCSCGNPIQVQCQICRTAICADCNALSGKTDKFTTGTSVYDIPSRRCFIPTVGYGYVFEDYALILARIPDSDNFQHGTLLCAEKILWTLQQQHSGLERACWNCVCNAIPDTVAAIEGELLCAGPDCAIKPSTWSRCECCHRAFCHLCCSADSPATIEGESVMSIVACRPCAQTWRQGVRLMLDSKHNSLVLQDGTRYTGSPTDEYSKLLDRHRQSADRHQYTVNGRTVRLAKRLNREEDRMKKAAATVWLEINERLEARKLTLSDGSCSCRRPYRIQDDRAFESARSAVMLVAQ
jgi:hypothetical protein